MQVEIPERRVYTVSGFRCNEFFFVIGGSEMDYTVRSVEVKRFRRRNKKTNVVEVVTVSNRNGLPVEEQLRLLNLND